MPSPYDYMQNRWLEWHEGLLDLESVKRRQSKRDEIVAKLREVMALLDELEQLEPGDVSDPPAPQAG